MTSSSAAQPSHSGKKTSHDFLVSSKHILAASRCDAEPQRQQILFLALTSGWARRAPMASRMGSVWQLVAISDRADFRVEDFAIEKSLN